LLTLHHAAKELFGEEGTRAIGPALPSEVRAATLDTEPMALSWYPTSYVVSWWAAVAAGPGKDPAAFDRFVQRSNDLGFGRVRKALLGFVGPEGLVTRAAELWRHDHTTGSLEIVAPLAAKEDGTIKGGVRALLRDHPFIETELGRRAITEALRYILSLARGVSQVRARHSMDARGLTMEFHWS
jgi:hypothetical protein